MRKILYIFLLISLISKAQIAQKDGLILMGSTFEITLICDTKVEAKKNMSIAINEIKRIEQLISSWNPNSQTSLINKNAGIKSVKVDKELFYLIKRCQKISKLSKGYFDISYAAFDKLWKFNKRNEKQDLPDSLEIRRILQLVDYTNIILNEKEQTVFLKEKGMKIGFGAVGKGYAAHKTKQLLVENGVKNGLVNASGDITAWGNNIEQEKWKIAVSNPKDKNKNIAEFNLSNQAVVTSGNYEKYFFSNGKRYAHIINPKTGYPAEGVASVTVFGPNAEVCDALATAVYIMGAKKGIEFINTIKDFDTLIIDDENKVFSSSNLNLN